MEQIRQAFWQETNHRIELLKSDLELLRHLQAQGNGKMRVLRHIFQQIHTLKGSSAAFELKNVSRFAHEIEDILEEIRAGRKLLDEFALSVLEEGIEHLEVLLKSVFAENEVEISAAILEKWSQWKKEPSQIAEKEPLDFFQRSFPAGLFEKLSQHEKNYLIDVLQDGARFFMVRAVFPFGSFSEKFQALRNALRKVSEVIATLPDKKKSADSINLQLICASDHEKFEIQNSLTVFAEAIEVEWCDGNWNNSETPPNNAGSITKNFDKKKAHSSVSLDLAVAQALLAGKKVAQTLGKEVRFEVIGEIPLVSYSWAEAISTALLHLVRNAVDHGIETPAERRSLNKTEAGLVRLEIIKNEHHLIICVSDDGCGINVDKVKRTALRRGWTEKDEPFSEEEAWQMIFKSGFSTSNLVSQVSGRGIGLDIAQNNIQKIGGEVRVQSKSGHGTTFEIVLPPAV